MSGHGDNNLSEPLLDQGGDGGSGPHVVDLIEAFDGGEISNGQVVISAGAESRSSSTNGGSSECSDEQGQDPESNGDAAAAADDAFTIKGEIVDMLHLGLPLAVSFFCRMGMASTDSAFVGHIRDAHHSAETYLAAAVLSDMCVSIFTTPPLAFNQVLNGLVGQAMGSGNPKMAGIWLQQSCFWLASTLLPCLAALFYVRPVLLLLGFPEGVAEVAGTYAKYNVLWPIPNGLYQCMRFYFQAQGLPRPAMYNNIIFLFVNAALNWTFVFGGPLGYLPAEHPLHWNGLGFIGAAISLSISRTMQGVTYFLYMFVYKKHHLNAWPDGGLSLQHHTAARTWEFMKQSLPNIGTLLFQVLAGQATTVLLGRLGELPIAASSALSTVTIPYSGSLSATCTTISGVRVGRHLGRGDPDAARKATWLVLYFITAFNAVVAIFFLVPSAQNALLNIATNDVNVLRLSSTLVPAMLVGNYLNLMVSNITSGVFSGMGRPVIATILSFGLELPMSIGGVAVYILFMHGNLLGVYWWQAISGGLELLIVAFILSRSDWHKCAEEAKQRQEASRNTDNENDSPDADPESTQENSDAVAGAEGDEESGLQEPLLSSSEE